MSYKTTIFFAGRLQIGGKVAQLLVRTDKLLLGLFVPEGGAELPGNRGEQRHQTLVFGARCG
ncbi:hypothetical protein L0337_34280 [candidate division KSB1 bacterium]|nr:hypothetical protein [candidate division KSB1 bacterium]